MLGDSFSLYVDQMFGEYMDGAANISKPGATEQTENGTAEEVTGKAMPGFDIVDYGQEDYVFENTEKDVCHWNTHLLEILEKYADVLEPLFHGMSNI